MFTSSWAIRPLIVSISCFLAWMMTEFERCSAMMSGCRSTGLPGCGGATAPGAAGGVTAGTAPGASERMRPLAKSWFRMVASWVASANLIGMIWSSSSATCTSTRRVMSRSRATFDAVSVTMSTFVSRWAMSEPSGEMSGRRSVERSATDV